MELLKVVVLVGAFLHVTMALSIEGVQEGRYCRKAVLVVTVDIYVHVLLNLMIVCVCVCMCVFHVIP